MLQDQFSDRSFRVFAEKIRSFPVEARDFFKTAEVNYDELESLPKTAFAWPEMRKFAIHSPEHAALSLVYAHDENLPEYVRKNLEKAAELYGVTMEPKQTEKVAETLDTSDYLLPDKSFGQITSKAQVKEASDFFSNNYKRMNLSERAQSAATLVKKAKEHSCRISPTYYRHAGLTQTNPKVLEEWLEVRAELAVETPIKESFKKLASHVGSSLTTASRRELIKLADTIALLDEKANLVRRYDITLPDPLLTVFNTSKVAESTLQLAGKQIPIDSLMGLDPRTYGDVLGMDVEGEISTGGQLDEGKLLDVLKTLPADLQMSLVKALGL